MDCVICYNITDNKTECNHSVCKECIHKLKKQECPYCRKKIKTWEYKNIKLPFYYFVHLFHENYRQNSIYQDLKVGIEYEDIISDTIYYVFEEKYNNCCWTTNYNGSITLQIYNIWDLPNSKKRIEFRTLGLDNDNIIHFHTFHRVENYDTYMKRWILCNL